MFRIKEYYGSDGGGEKKGGRETGRDGERERWKNENRERVTE